MATRRKIPAPFREYLVRMRRTIIESYSVEAESEDNARRKAERFECGPGLEIDQEDWEILRVEEAPR